jgi:hypothetical protein
MRPRIPGRYTFCETPATAAYLAASGPPPMLWPAGRGSRGEACSQSLSAFRPACYFVSVPAEKQTGGAEPFAAALDRLYAAPLEQFVALRRELVASLRASGDPPAARLLAAAIKPTRTAWALNRVARSHPELLRGFFDARDRAAAAQVQGNAEQARTAVREYRERMAEVGRAAREALGEAGVAINAAQVRRIGESLQASSTGDADARATLLAGRLARDEDVQDPFAGLEVGGARPRPGPDPQPSDGVVGKREAAARAAHERAMQRERARRERALEEARQRVASLEHEAREARAVAMRAEAATRRAQSAEKLAMGAAEQAEERLERARADLRAKTI